MTTPFQRLMAVYGQHELARKLRITQQAVFHWRRRGIPPARIAAIVELSAGRLTPHDLRPDIYP